MDETNPMRQMLGNKEPFNALDKFIRNNQTNEAINYIKEYCSCDEATAKTLFVDFKIEYDTIFSQPSTLSPAEIAHNNAIAQDWQNKPKCPTCSSTNLKKISATSKVVNTAVFGLFGTKRHKTFHCNNCGYEW